MNRIIPITLAYGDGVGPEIMRACLTIFDAAGALLDYETIELGEKVYQQGITSGISAQAWESIRRTGVLFKAPVHSPSYGGMKSVTMTLRKTLGLYANIRPCVAYSPFIRTHFPEMDVVVIRENEEGLYAGVEHRQTPNVYQSLKIVSTGGCERIIRYAFEYAIKHQRKKVSCFTKDNILKLTDGLFHRTFDKIASEYPQLKSEHYQIDTGGAKFVDVPEEFDVLVLPNLYGDIISAMASEMAGSLQVGASANVGERCAMFEAIHGSEPYDVGTNLANPSGLLLSGVMMLAHIGQADVAQRIHNAWLKTIEEHIHTQDVYDESTTQQVVGTQEFAQAIIKRLGTEPQHLKPVRYEHYPLTYQVSKYSSLPSIQRQDFVGIDVFALDNSPIDVVSERMKKAAENTPFELTLITSRGVKVWPTRFPETLMGDHWRCRFILKDRSLNSSQMVIQLLQECAQIGINFIKTEHLYEFDGEPGYSLGQGE